MTTRWECRYSSCEMLYLEIDGGRVHLYLHHSKDRGDWYTFEQVTAGMLDAEVNGLFGGETLAGLHAAVKAFMTHTVPPVETRQQAMERRRREG